MIFVAENSNKLQKTRFCKEKSVENMWSHLKVYHSIQVWELGCAFGIAEKFLMNGI